MGFSISDCAVIGLVPHAHQNLTGSAKAATSNSQLQLICGSVTVRKIGGMRVTIITAPIKFLFKLIFGLLKLTFVIIVGLLAFLNWFTKREQRQSRERNAHYAQQKSEQLTDSILRERCRKNL